MLSDTCVSGSVPNVLTHNATVEKDAIVLKTSLCFDRNISLGIQLFQGWRRQWKINTFTYNLEWRWCKRAIFKIVVQCQIQGNPK